MFPSYLYIIPAVFIYLMFLTVAHFWDFGQPSCPIIKACTKHYFHVYYLILPNSSWLTEGKFILFYLITLFQLPGYSHNIYRRNVVM